MASPRSYHSSSAASSSANLAPPSPTPLHKQQRRNTTPSLPPPSAIDLPEPVYGTREGHRRSPSPLRNSFTVDGKGSEDGSDDGSDGGGWGQRSRSPNPSITQMATDFAQRMGSFMNGRTGHLPTDAELEAEAQRERERSRREAERILMQEADERRAMEDKVLAMLQQTPSRPRAQTMPSPMEMPSPSQKDKDVPGWWTAAKTKLTPTKEPLTPAQQVIQETKDRERKEKKEAKKRADKERKRSNEWPTTPEKYGDPAMEVLTTPPRRPVPNSPASGSGLSKPMSLPPSLAPSPLRSQDAAKSSTGSPSREAQPLYAQFNPQGVLDVPATLLTIAKRFEKLEKWAVGHVRALEERMSDVERWLVDKEHERERESLASKPEAAASDSQTGTGAAITEIREEMVELQGRIGELGREMAKLATAPMNLSNGPSRAPAHVSTAPPTSSAIALPAVQQPSTPRRTPSQSHSRRESMSPPFIPAGVQQKETPRSRLPYPTGDYTSPTDIAMSPPGSPPPTLSVDLRTRPISIAGLPSAQNPSLSHSSSLNSLSGLPRAMSPPSASASPSARLGSSTNGGVNSSPTPRKRYTVALDAPIMKRSESPVSMSEESEDGGEETIGRAAARRNGYSSDAPVLHQSHSREASSHAREPSRGGRARPVSMMPGAATTPLRIRMRSQSAVSEPTDEEPLPPLTPGSSGTGRFVDPLVLRREKKEMTRDTAPTQVAAAAARRKMQVRELAAFFDKDKM